MKRYVVEYRRASYITTIVEADSPEAAEAKAWEEIEERADVDDAVWEFESIEDLDVDDDSRSNGPRV